MKEQQIELLCAALLGFGQLCVMTGFDTEFCIVEPVIHSVHRREPERISPYAGSYGQAVLYAAYTIACLFAPSLAAVSDARTILVISAALFTTFPLGFLFTNSDYYYFSSILLGIGIALFYQGQGAYWISHSTRQTIESNVSLTWSVGCCGMIVGAAILAGITWMSEDEVLNVAVNRTGELHATERTFSDWEIYLIFSAFTAISAIGILTFFFMPSKDIENCIESSVKKGNFLKYFRLTCSAVVSSKMLQLFPLFSLCGLHTSVWISIFPTAMSFQTQNSHLIYLPAVYTLGLGIGQVVMGIVISYLSKRIKDFGQKPTMTLGTVFLVIYYTLIHMSTASDAPMRPTMQEPPLIRHSYLLALFIGCIGGMADCCINSVRSVICALVMPTRRAQAYSVSKIYQALASCFLFFLSPVTPIFFYTVGLPITSMLATILLFLVVNGLRKEEKKIVV